MIRRGLYPYVLQGAVPPPLKPEAAPHPWGGTFVVGKPLPRIDAYERVSGSAVYTQDVILPGMLYGAILRCPHAHALVKKVDVSKAAGMPGVRAVLSDADPAAQIPWFTDFVERKPASRLFDAHCRHQGEEVAAVAADTPQQAWDAIRAIKVEYEQRPFVVDAEEALKPDAPKVHDRGNRVFPPGVGDVKRGDVEKGFAEADVVLEETYRTPTLIHTPTETHGSVAKWDGNRLTVWDSTQGVFPIQAELAEKLKLPLASVRVIGHYMGGGFGSKIALGKYTVIAALLAKKAARPVKLCLTREESFLATGNRPGHSVKLKAGVKKDGTLTAFQMTGVGSVGAYAEWTTIGHQVAELYTCPNVKVEEAQSFIHAGQTRAFRAPGFPQGNWVLEQMMDALAEKIGMDPVEFRLKSIPAISQTENKPYTSTGLSRCLKEGAEAFGWKQARAREKDKGPVVRGVGVAAAIWGYGGEPPSTAIVKLYPDGSANLNMGAADLGTGTKTVMSMIVSEELGTPLERIQVENADTGTTQYTDASGGSKTVAIDGPAVRLAALDVKRQVLEMAAAHLKVAASELTLKNGEVFVTAAPEKKVAFGELPGMGARVIVGVGRRGPNPEGKIVRPFSVHFAEVEVNTRTGEVRVLRLVGAHDSGRVMNLRTYENQVFGGMTMGLGFGMTESRVMDRNTGRMANANWHDYKVPTAKDVPLEVACVPVDPHDTECNNIGAKGLGEPATIPTAAAIANAVYNATGIRVTAGPIDRAKMMQLLAERGKRGA